jgi:hypothetical protein
VRRGWVYVLTPDEPEFAGRIFDRYRADEVQVHRVPEAQILGHLKAGVRERPSARKAAACRANGKCPCRPGKRRGRPPKQQSQESTVLGHS